MFVNGCVGTTSTALAVNGANLSNATTIAYLGNSGYQPVTAGNTTLNATLTGVGSLGSVTANLTANDNYSVFECGTVLADSIIIVNDAMPAASATYAYARVVNTSSDTSATAITGAVGNTVVGSNIAYAAASGAGRRSLRGARRRPGSPALDDALADHRQARHQRRADR